MPFTVELETGERLLLETGFTASKNSEPFAFAVTDRGVFVPRKKLFAVKDPYYFERVPLSHIREVRIEPVRPYIAWTVAALMIAAGLVTTYLMMVPILRGEGGKVSGYPPAIVVVGLVIPYVIRGRRALVVRTTKGHFRWKAPLVVDGKSRTRIASVQEEILVACKKAGMHVFEADSPFDV